MLSKCKTAAKLRKGIDIPIDEKMFCFTFIHYKIESISEAFGEVHGPCRIEFLNNRQHDFRNIDINKLHTKYLSVVIVRFKNKNRKFKNLLPDRNCHWLEMVFASYATQNKTLTLFNTKRYHCSFISCNSWWKFETIHMTRHRLGTSSTMLNITGFELSMPQGNVR